MGSNAKTDNFLKAIRRHVKAQKRQMLSEVSQIKEEQLTIAKNKAKQDSKVKDRIRLEESKVKARIVEIILMAIMTERKLLKML